MKLLFCKSCHDIRAIRAEKTTCACGSSWGKYTDDLNAEIGGQAVPLGLTNDSFIKALVSRPDGGLGSLFTAFVIPKKCPTVTEKGEDCRV